MKGTPKRMSKQQRKEQLKEARKAIVNTVPEKGRGIFKGGNDIEDSDIEPFDDHD
jgi:hypothetical protein